MEDLKNDPDKLLARATYDAINNGGIFPDGHEWAGFTYAESLSLSRKMTAEQARAAKAAQAAPVAVEVKDTGKLATTAQKKN